MNPNIEQLKSELEPLRQELLNHPLYSELKSIDDVSAFMSHHIFAVWDFMSLLKSLQREFTSVSMPWMPTPNAKLRRLINEIVLGEESDQDEHGETLSHYELYRKAMAEVGSSTSAVDQFLAHVSRGLTVEDALANTPCSESVKTFVNYTFSVIHSGKMHAVAGLFTFGREDLIPDMFTALVKDFDRSSGGKLSTFVYYLDRHIELDGDEHGPLAMLLIEELCGDDPIKWREVSEYSQKALQVRIGMWDGIMQELENRREKSATLVG